MKTWQESELLLNPYECLMHLIVFRKTEWLDYYLNSAVIESDAAINNMIDSAKD